MVTRGRPKIEGLCPQAWACLLEFSPCQSWWALLNILWSIALHCFLWSFYHALAMCIVLKFLSWWNTLLFLGMHFSSWKHDLFVQMDFPSFRVLELCDGQFLSDLPFELNVVSWGKSWCPWVHIANEMIFPGFNLPSNFYGWVGPFCRDPFLHHILGNNWQRPDITPDKILNNLRV